MSKKAAAVAEAAPKFAQPWQGFLSFGVIFILAYVTLQWFIHPVWGIFTKLVLMNAFVADELLGSLGLILAINNPNYMTIYPLGYLVNWVSYFVFCIVWFVSIAFLARPFTPSTSKLRKQPWAGIIILALSMFFAFLTWLILGVVMKWQAYEMIVLGTAGFLIFPIWVTLFGYWPFIPKKMGAHPLVRGIVYSAISWFLAFLIRGIISMRMWSNALPVVGTQFLLGNPLMPLTPTEPYDFWVSMLLSIIVGSGIVSQLNLFPAMPQPKRGLVLFILAIVIGLIMWGIITLILGNSSQTILMSGATPVLITFPYVNHGAVSAYLAFPLVTLLAGQLTFGMWPWTKYGNRAGLMLVIAAFIIGSIVYYIVMVSPLGLAGSITGANLVTAMSGLQTLYLHYLAVGAYQTYWVFLLYFEGVAAFIGRATMFAWVLTVLIFYLLAYEGFEHWPWK